ncbi:uncharacterized protein TNCV_5095381 [Trichonephila clavipes]|nr:uncharacterized protein TNCV_5095381 [Trichonephila clavipes]
MPRKHKSNLSPSSNIARDKKVAIFNETFPQAERRRLEQAESEAAHSAAETPEQFQARRFQHASQRDTETIEAAGSRKRAVAERAQQRRLIFTKNTWEGGVFDKAAFEYDETLDYESHKLIKIEAMIKNADFAVLLNGKRNLQACVDREGGGVALPSKDEPVEPLK